MDFEEKKTQLLKMLDELEIETKTLLERIQKAREALPMVKTFDDVEKYGEEYDLEAGFKHIELFY